MTQITPATCVLGPGKTGLAIGLRVLDIDRVQYSAFSTTNVAETNTAGTYSKAGGAVAPLAGGYIVWGTAGVDLVEATVDAAPTAAPSASDNATAAAAAILVTPANKLATSATGEAAANVTLWAGVAVAGAPALEATAQAILEDTGTTLPGLISAGGGTGLYSETITVNDLDGSPVDGVLVQVATDSGFSNIIRSGYTNGLGRVTFNYDAAGTYYGRAEIAGYGVQTFTVEVSA